MPLIMKDLHLIAIIALSVGSARALDAGGGPHTTCRPAHAPVVAPCAPAMGAISGRRMPSRHGHLALSAEFCWRINAAGCVKPASPQMLALYFDGLSSRGIGGVRKGGLRNSTLTRPITRWRNPLRNSTVLWRAMATLFLIETVVDR